MFAEGDIQRQLKEEEEKKLQAEDTFSSKQQEAEIKTKKLKKLFGKFEAAKIEIEDLQEVCHISTLCQLREARRAIYLRSELFCADLATLPLSLLSDFFLYFSIQYLPPEGVR